VTGGNVTPTLDVKAVQQALDALISGDQASAAEKFTEDVVLTGAGGCLGGRTTGLSGVLDRFADMSRLTHGTFGTEVAAVYTGGSTQLVAILRHWAILGGEEIHATQAAVFTTQGKWLRAVDVLSTPGPRTGIWD
jgi:hypothetical protein